MNNFEGQKDFFDVLDRGGDSNSDRGRIEKLEKELEEVEKIIDNCSQCELAGFTVGCTRHKPEINKYFELKGMLDKLLEGQNFANHA
jgi:hypothetical protein